MLCSREVLVILILNQNWEKNQTPKYEKQHQNYPRVKEETSLATEHTM